jgi:hypothetical protein
MVSFCYNASESVRLSLSAAMPLRVSHTMSTRFGLKTRYDSHVGRCCYRPPFWGVWGSWDGPSNVALITRVPDGPKPLWRSSLLWGWAYPMSGLSWKLCMFLWWSGHVRRWSNESQYSSACCQVCVGACDHVVSCQAFNAAASWGPDSSGSP